MIVEKNVLGAVTLLEEVVYQGRELTQFVTDFTWYLRNLLLLKSTDDIEDFIDAWFLTVNDENLMPHVMKFADCIAAESARSDYQYIFHKNTPFNFLSVTAIIR